MMAVTLNDKRIAAFSFFQSCFLFPLEIYSSFFFLLLSYFLSLILFFCSSCLSCISRRIESTIHSSL
ncbi:hypothetical protein BDW42DRAFT_167848 [Aspergillus taichungensis]|uniref:Uncharacterized protein n=1 Tax=Aspergillus taichungensis TaxID=482145 RepID=A0A2J5HX51_9EURO|nr:hypothetical protein BDW42DRAFT_167848 [Aspergillus taichungensis]